MVFGCRLTASALVIGALVINWRYHPVVILRHAVFAGRRICALAGGACAGGEYIDPSRKKRAQDDKALASARCQQPSCVVAVHLLQNFIAEAEAVQGPVIAELFVLIKMFVEGF